jgi:hypothetical protein
VVAGGGAALEDCDARCVLGSDIVAVVLCCQVDGGWEWQETRPGLG